MKISSVEISRVRSGAELLQAWDQIGYRPPAPPGKLISVRRTWAEAMNDNDKDILVARAEAPRRVGHVAVGFIYLKWSGPVSTEPEFSEALADEYPDDIPISTLYSLTVDPRYYGNNLGWRLTSDAERRIRRRQSATDLAALNVRVDNIHALPIYINRNYKVLPYKGQKSVKLDRPTPSGHSRDRKPVYLMVKDLSDPTKK